MIYNELTGTKIVFREDTNHNGGNKTGISRSASQSGTVASGKIEIGKIQEFFTDGSTNSKKTILDQYPNNTRYKSPSPITSTFNHAEQNVLGNVANELDKIYSNKFEAKGNIHLFVEQEVCSTCRQGFDPKNSVLPGVIKQFSDEYKNVTVIIRNASKPQEILIIRDGKRIQ